MWQLVVTCAGYEADVSRLGEDTCQEDCQSSVRCERYKTGGSVDGEV